MHRFEYSGESPPRYFILDLDGTLVRGMDAVRGAAELLDVLGDRYMIVSNNSTHCGVDLSADLRRGGLDVPEGRLVLAGPTAVDAVARTRPGARTLLLGTRTLKRLARRAGLRLVDGDGAEDDCDVVLVSRDVDFTYGKLARAANALRRGADLVVTNPDLWHPGRDGAVVPETGSLVRALTACAAPKTVQRIGKPEPWLFREALRRLNAAPADCVVVGDNPDTDGAGARRLGIPCLLLDGTGGAGITDIAALARTLKATVR